LGGAGIVALIELLDLAGADGQGLVVAGPDHLAAAEVLDPGGAAEGDVAGRHERVGLDGGQRSPGAVDRVGGVGGEDPAAGRGDRLDDQQVFLLGGSVAHNVTVTRLPARPAIRRGFIPKGFRLAKPFYGYHSKKYS
jgi:hypothetical protein